MNNFITYKFYHQLYQQQHIRFNIQILTILLIMTQLQVKDSPQVEPLSNAMTVVGLVNGMIGGTILVLPIIGFNTGYITTLIVCAIMGYLTYYTSYLIILHLGKAENITISTLTHFKQDPKYLLFYNFLIWVSFVTILPIYFKLICLQIEGLIGHQSIWIGPIVSITLIASIIISRIFNYSEEVIGYGIISHILFIIFLIWAQITAPQGPKTVKPIGDPIKLIGALITAFSIHDFIAQNMVKNPNKKEYSKLIKYTFIIGTIAYTFIAYACFAIINRTPHKSRPETINDYFPIGGWQIAIIQIVYIIHLFSSYPNFLLVSQASFFQMFNVKIQDKMQWKELVYITMVIIVGYLCYALNVYLDVMIAIDGAIVGITYVFMYPIWIHLKCVFYDKSSGFIEGEDQWNKGIQMNVCQCDNTYSSKWALYLQTFFLICVLIIGLIFMTFSIIQIFNNPSYFSEF